MSLIHFDVLFSSSISIISMEVILRLLAFIIYGYGNVWVQIYVGVLLNWIVLFTSGILTSASLVNFLIGYLVLTSKGLVCGAVYLKGVLFNEQSNTILMLKLWTLQQLFGKFETPPLSLDLDDR